MAWTPTGIHIGRTGDDYPSLLELRRRYPTTIPPIEDLREACLKDGYPEEQVLKMTYTALPDIEDLLMKRSRKRKPVPKPIEEPLSDTDDVSDTEDVDHVDDAFDVEDDEQSDTEDVEEDFDDKED